MKSSLLLLPFLLWPFSILYEGAMRVRAHVYAAGWRKQKRLPGTVISVGNLTLGGTGKTPMVIWLAEKFLAQGKRVAILSRGYRGANGTSDEIELMKNRLQNRVLFGVGKDRHAEGQRLIPEGIDVFILDDGFQHLPLARDVDIVLIDSTRPLDSERVLPAGTLREPLSALRRADLIVLTRSQSFTSCPAQIQALANAPVYLSTTRLLGFYKHGDPQALRALRQAPTGPVFAFCGIGNPDAFFCDLDRWNVQVAGTKSFRDHHRYTLRDINALTEAARRAGAKTLLATEKDAHNLEPALQAEVPVEVAVIATELHEENQFFEALNKRVHTRDGVAA
jgi:tetraacyldisaccharide 4'-kinase